MKPCCYDCLSEDVAVEVIIGPGISRWFCAEDWAGWQEFHKRLLEFLAAAS